MSISVDERLQILDALFATSNSNIYLTDTKEKVFLLCWEGNSYQEIAVCLGYDYDYIKKVGSQLWRSISQALGKKVTKSNFRSLLRQYAIQKQIDSLKSASANHNHISQSNNPLARKHTPIEATAVTSESKAVFRPNK